MMVTDQTVKLRIVFLTGAFALIGFFLEIGPVGGVFSLANSGISVLNALTLELATFGFLAYLALAASAVIGLHLSEEEPTPKEEKPTEPLQATSEGGAAPEEARVRVRPELHQLRMLFTALGGFALLKGINLALMWPTAVDYGMTTGTLVRVFEFGFIYVALGWFILWQFLRWYALRKKWIRLQEELVGVDVSRVIAVAILVKPVIFFAGFLLRGPNVGITLWTMAALLHLTLIAVAILLWKARPFTLRRTLIGLGIIGGVIILLTAILAVIERGAVG